MIIVGRRGDESSYCGGIFLLINVRDAAVRDLEGALSLRHVGRVVDLGDALLAAALLEVDPDGRGASTCPPIGCMRGSAADGQAEQAREEMEAAVHGARQRGSEAEGSS